MEVVDARRRERIQNSAPAATRVTVTDHAGQAAAAPSARHRVSGQRGGRHGVIARTLGDALPAELFRTALLGDLAAAQGRRVESVRARAGQVGQAACDQQRGEQAAIQNRPLALMRRPRPRTGPAAGGTPDRDAHGPPP